MFSSRCATLLGAGDGQHHRRAVQHPGERELRRRRRRAASRHSSSAPPAPASSPVASGNHGMKAMPSLLAVVEHVLVAAVGEVVAVLHRDDVDDLPRPARSRRPSTSERPMWPDLALVAAWPTSSPSESSTGTCGSMRCSWYRSMRSSLRRRRLISTSWRRYSGRPQRRASCRARCAASPPWCAMTRSSGYGCSASAISSSLTYGPVGVGGVDEGDAELDGAAQHADALVAVGRRAPDARAGELHGAVAEAVDGQVAAQGHGAAGFSWCRHDVFVPGATKRTRRACRPCTTRGDACQPERMTDSVP